GQKRQQFYGFAVNRESALDVYSKRRIIAVIDLKIVEWHNYKHLDWISDVYEEYRHSVACGRSLTESRKLPKEAQPYKARHVSIRSKATRSVYGLFEPKRIYLSKQEQEKQGIRMQYLPTTIWRKGDKDRAAAMIQAIDKMLKTRMIMRSLEGFVGGRHYQKRLNLTKPDTYRSDLKRREAYTAHSNPRGFIYQNKDKKNILMRIDELHKFSDGTLNDVRNALDDRLKGIRM
nr:hypothetical protein [Tanacetum cinerariifolium]